MSREQQRRHGVLAARMLAAKEQSQSTVPITLLLSADELQNLLQETDAQLFRDYAPTLRRRMASEGRAMPDGSWPIGNCADAADAVHALDTNGPALLSKRGRVEAHIKKRTHALRCGG